MDLSQFSNASKRDPNIADHSTVKKWSVKNKSFHIDEEDIADSLKVLGLNENPPPVVRNKRVASGVSGGRAALLGSKFVGIVARAHQMSSQVHGHQEQNRPQSDVEGGRNDNKNGDKNETKADQNDTPANNCKYISFIRTCDIRLIYEFHIR